MRDLSTYFGEVGKHKLLTSAEEVQLSKLIEKGDKRARDRMIQANLRLAISIAKKYQNSGCSLEDLIQESSVGLIKAVDRFDWRKGFKFSTYACWWIKQSVRKHIASLASPIKMPTHARGILWKIKVAREEYKEEFNVEPSMKELAEIVGIREETMKSIIQSARHSISLDAKIGKDGEGRSVAETVPDNKDTVEDMLDRQNLVKIVKSALEMLSPREEKVLRLRFGIEENSRNHKNFPMTNSDLKVLQKRVKNK